MMTRLFLYRFVVDLLTQRTEKFDVLVDRCNEVHFYAKVVEIDPF